MLEPPSDFGFSGSAIVALTTFELSTASPPPVGTTVVRPSPAPRIVLSWASNVSPSVRG